MMRGIVTPPPTLKTPLVVAFPVPALSGGFVWPFAAKTQNSIRIVAKAAWELLFMSN